MTEELSEALESLDAYRSTLLKESNFMFYENLLLEDVSEAISKLSFLECCGLLSVYYNDHEHYPDLCEEDIFSYLESREDYYLPLQLVLLSKGRVGKFYVARTKIIPARK